MKEEQDTNQNLHDHFKILNKSLKYFKRKIDKLAKKETNSEANNKKILSYFKKNNDYLSNCTEEIITSLEPMEREITRFFQNKNILEEVEEQRFGLENCLVQKETEEKMFKNLLEFIKENIQFPLPSNLA